LFDCEVTICTTCELPEIYKIPRNTDNKRHWTEEILEEMLSNTNRYVVDLAELEENIEENIEENEKVSSEKKRN
jgi:hypothetical protein